jgi:hypothetical protein
VPLGKARHICALFRDRQGWYEVLLPFIREGLHAGDKAFHIIDGERRTEHLDRLRQGAIEAAEFERRGQLEVKGWLEVRGWHEAYLLGGRFDPEAMLAFLEAALQRGKAEGFRLTRLIAEMEWVLSDRSAEGDLLEYEARLNDVLPQYDDAVT